MKYPEWIIPIRNNGIRFWIQYATINDIAMILSDWSRTRDLVLMHYSLIDPLFYDIFEKYKIPRYPTVIYKRTLYRNPPYYLINNETIDSFKNAIEYIKNSKNYRIVEYFTIDEIIEKYYEYKLRYV